MEKTLKMRIINTTNTKSNLQYALAAYQSAPTLLFLSPYIATFYSDPEENHSRNNNKALACPELDQQVYC